jgi:hypothetical protein
VKQFLLQHKDKINVELFSTLKTNPNLVFNIDTFSNISKNVDVWRGGMDGDES